MQNEKYWQNGSGYYDPTAAETINTLTREEKARSKEIHDTVQQIKNILKNKDLELLDRIKLKDTRNNKEYI